MYLANNIVLKSYESLSGIHSGGDGKAARERTSGLRYLLATSQLLHESGLESIDLSPIQKDNRSKFIEAVGRVVKLNDDFLYSNNFRDEFEKRIHYRVGNNFLTSALKRNGPYPGRPAPLLLRTNENLSLHKDYLENLNHFGDFSIYRIGLALWLLRYDDFKQGNNENVIDQILKKLEDRYGQNVTNKLIENHQEVINFIGDETLLNSERGEFEYIIADKFNGEQKEDSLQRGVNKIIYGAPGTGKSYYVNSYSPSIRTVFHIDYLNSDFLGSYRPYSKDDKIIYRFVPGPFILSFIEALKNPHSNFHLIIEEINRANASSVFGEVFQLLDRDSDGESIYKVNPDIALKDFLDLELKDVDEWSGQLFIPKNLSIIATMNSADQGVELLDSAFKRRWTFVYMPINFEAIPVEDIRNKEVIPYSDIFISWAILAEKINLVLAKSGLPEDRLLGQFFISEEDLSSEEQIQSTICGKLFIYLWDDALRHGLRNLIFDTENISSFNDLIIGYVEGDKIFCEELNIDLGASTV